MDYDRCCWCFAIVFGVVTSVSSTVLALSPFIPACKLRVYSGMKHSAFVCHPSKGRIMLVLFIRQPGMKAKAAAAQDSPKLISPPPGTAPTTLMRAAAFYGFCCCPREAMLLTSSIRFAAHLQANSPHGGCACKQCSEYEKCMKTKQWVKAAHEHNAKSEDNTCRQCRGNTRHGNNAERNIACRQCNE
eukprot:1155953-Pelagomonas_calceolata.AAC.2